jgi:hypothetical protein
MSEQDGWIMRTLEWAYERALEPGVAGIESAKSMADDYRTPGSDYDAQVKALIRWQCAKAATSGVATGMFGLAALPITIPANVASVLYVQVRMVAAIAVLSGHDPKNDKVKTLIYLCLCGSLAHEVLRGVGVRLGEKLAERAMAQFTGEVIKQVNKAVGFRLVTKFGTTGVLNFGKMVPFVGGVLGGTVDAFATKGVGTIARELFRPEE